MSRILLIVCALCIAVCVARPKWYELDGYSFDAFIRDYNRPYAKGTAVYAMREEVFYNRLKNVRAHNADGTKTWKKGINLFSDLTDEEWKNFNKAYKSPHRAPPQRIHKRSGDNAAPLPRMVDYRTWTSPRVLTAVKHQGSCGSCWAFSATESLEAYYALLTGMEAVLSPQQITSCTGLGTAGCNGGDAILAFQYLNSTYYGATEEWAYPYANFFFDPKVPGYNETQKCINITEKFPNKNPYSWFAELNRVGVNGYVSVNPNDAQATMDALATTGPLSISVAAGNWQDYESGVMKNDDKWGPYNEWGIDHDVQMVGYGRDEELGLNYWIVRNSWSTLWGEAGFVRLDRPDVEPCSPQAFGPVCGTAGCLNDPHFPLVRKNPGQPF